MEARLSMHSWEIPWNKKSKQLMRALKNLQHLNAQEAAELQISKK